jgi:hypothetical protein
MRLVLPALLALAVVLAGCTAPDAPAGVTKVAGVAPRDGALNLTGSNGILVQPDAANSTVRLGLGDIVESPGTFHACAAACDVITVPRGAIIAEGPLISFENLTLNALGPDRDAAILFYDNGTFAGQWLRWLDGGDNFELSDDLDILGNVTARMSVGTATLITLASDPPRAAHVITAATEGNEATVFFRGSGRLTNGAANITFPEPFRVLVGNGPITAQVSLTSLGGALYVAEKTPAYMVVRSTVLPSEATFDFFIQASRAGSEGFQTLR